MNASAAVAVTLLTLAVLANLPFVSSRVLVLGPLRPQRGLGTRLAELVLLGAIALGVGWALEGQVGQRHPQGWAFFVTWFCLLLTCAFPGFVWRYLRRGDD